MEDIYLDQKDLDQMHEYNRQMDYLRATKLVMIGDKDCEALLIKTCHFHNYLLSKYPDYSPHDRTPKIPRANPAV